MRFITDDLKLNQIIVRNPHPLPRIGEKIQQLEGFHYATELDLNMGYYTIDISSESCDLTTIFTEFWKFRYNRVLVGLYASGDIFKAKVDNTLGDIEGVKLYISDMLIIGKGSFYQHIYQPIVIFDRMRAAGLKLNTPKWIFGLKDITYLVYIITREGIKTNPKKVQGIMDLGRPTTMTEERALIWMVQYYREIWSR